MGKPIGFFRSAGEFTCKHITRVFGCPIANPLLHLLDGVILGGCYKDVSFNALIPCIPFSR